MSKKTFIIFDGNSFIDSSSYELPSFTSKSGFQNQIITGACNMINRVLKDFDYDKFVVAFDVNRKNALGTMLDDRIIKQEPLKKILLSFGLPMLSLSEVDTGDSIFSLALQSEREGFNVIMVISDKDIFQVRNDHISMLNTQLDLTILRVNY